MLVEIKTIYKMHCKYIKISEVLDLHASRRTDGHNEFNKRDISCESKYYHTVEGQKNVNI